MQIARYRELRRMVEDRGYDHEIEWAESVVSPPTPEDLWREYSWVVLNSGMRNQVAESIWRRVRPEVESNGSAHNVFGHQAKAEAIDRFWNSRATRFGEMEAVIRADQLLPWCAALPWVGPTTKWHLAKNLGADVAKPDRWLIRVAAAAGVEVVELCARLAAESGDRVATVDLVIWRACNLGLWTGA
jgi:hypothetical protein